MIVLRQLRESDAIFMFEWMHDYNTQKNFQKNMLNVTLDGAKRFCRKARLGGELKQGQDIHLAIVDDEDEYLGTISLKNINLDYRSAEFAIGLRKKARGQGIAAEATDLLLKKGFQEIGLHRIYLTVLADNTAAIKLYEKCGFIYEGELRDHIFKDGKYISWKLYGMLENEYGKEEALRIVSRRERD